jgi:hypothetical protein
MRANAQPFSVEGRQAALSRHDNARSSPCAWRVGGFCLAGMMLFGVAAWTVKPGASNAHYHGGYYGPPGGAVAFAPTLSALVPSQAVRPSMTKGQQQVQMLMQPSRAGTVSMAFPDNSWRRAYDGKVKQSPIAGQSVSMAAATASESASGLEMASTLVADGTKISEDTIKNLEAEPYHDQSNVPVNTADLRPYPNAVSLENKT